MRDPIGSYIDWMDEQSNATLFVLSFFGAVFAMIGFICLCVWIGMALSG